MKILKKFDSYIKENQDGYPEGYLEQNPHAPSEETMNKFRSLHDEDDFVKADETEEEEGDKYSAMLDELAEALGTDVVTDEETGAMCIKYEGKTINVYSEDDMYHIDRKKFKTVDEVVTFLNGDKPKDNMDPDDAAAIHSYADAMGNDEDTVSENIDINYDEEEEEDIEELGGRRIIDFEDFDDDIIENDDDEPYQRAMNSMDDPKKYNRIKSFLFPNISGATDDELDEEDWNEEDWNEEDECCPNCECCPCRCNEIDHDSNDLEEDDFHNREDEIEDDFNESIHMSHMKHLRKFNEVKLIARPQKFSQATYQRDEYTYEKGKQQALEVAKEMEDQFLVDLKNADYPISVEVRDDSKRFIGGIRRPGNLNPGLQDFWRIFVTITDSTRPYHKIVKWGDVKDDITHLINYYNKGDFEVTNIYARKLKDGGRMGRAYALVGSGGEAYNWDNFCKNTKDEEEFIFFQIRFAERT